MRQSTVGGWRASFWSLCAIALSSLLVACPSERPAYRLGGVLPSPVTPGDAVTAFGLLPKEAMLTLGGSSVPGVRVSNGIQFTVPRDAMAGDHALEVSGDGITLSGVVSVMPRLDSAALDGATLQMRGAGWPTTGTLGATVVLVDGVRLTPIRDGAGLRVTLPARAVYGTIRVAVQVEDRLSETKGLQLEAGTVRGRVLFPVASMVAPMARVLAPKRVSLLALIVQATPSQLESLTLEPIEPPRHLAALGVTRLVFASTSAVYTARARLEQAGFKVWNDEPVNIADAADTRPITAPQGGAITLLDSGLKPSAAQWHLTLAGIPDAWVQGCTGANATVAVIDTGADLEHPDLKANLLPGYDFVDDDRTAQDIAGHGTHVAGLVAANGKAFGVAPEARILPVRVIRDLSGGSSFTVAQGILWAAGLLDGQPNPNPARVINLSLGSDDTSPLIAEAVRRVARAGVIVVAAAGNSGGGLAFPASMPEVIAVTALAGPKIQYQPWYASRGDGLWITAFGGDNSQDQDADGSPDGIYSTDLTASGYGLRNGTSMAAPQVAGLAALALSCGVPAPLVRGVIAGTATDLGPMGYDVQFGHGAMSARLATTSSPRAYAVAFEGGRVISYSVVQSDGTFLVGNLPPSRPILVVIASDSDGDGTLGEAGDVISNAVALEPRMGVMATLDNISLSLSDGQRAFSLEVK